MDLDLQITRKHPVVRASKKAKKMKTFSLLKLVMSEDRYLDIFAMWRNGEIRKTADL